MVRIVDLPNSTRPIMPTCFYTSKFSVQELSKYVKQAVIAKQTIFYNIVNYKSTIRLRTYKEPETLVCLNKTSIRDSDMKKIMTMSRVSIYLFTLSFWPFWNIVLCCKSGPRSIQNHEEKTKNAAQHRVTASDRIRRQSPATTKVRDNLHLI